MRKTNKLAFASLVLSGAMMFGACAPAGQSGSGNSSSNTTTTTTSSTGSSTSNGGSTQPSTGASSTSGGTNTGASAGDIKFQLYQKPTSFDPFHALNGADGMIAGLQFLPLMSFQDGKYIPRIAKSWESSDAQTYKIVLNDATWSDGSAITADDVAFTLQTYLAKDVASSFGGPMKIIEGAKDYSEGKATSISGIKVVDPKNLEIKLAAPSNALLPVLAETYIVPKAVYSKVQPSAIKGSEELRSPKVGSGPYMFSKWVNDDTIEFVANPKALYKAQASKLYAKYLTGDVAVAQLQTGEVDIADVPSTDIESLKSKINIVTKPGNKLMTLHTAMPNGHLVDKRVRQAIMYAIDRQAIIDSVLAGHGKIAGSVMFAPDWAQADGQNEYKYDPEKAKALLKEAGWKAETPIQLDIVPGQADRDAVFRIVVGQLQAVGINAKITTHQPAETAKMLKDNAFDLLITPLTMAVPEPSQLNNRLLCSQKSPAGINITGYCNETLDPLLLEAAKETDQAKRAETYKKVTKLLNEEVPIFPLYVADLNTGTTKTIKGYDPSVNPVTAVADKWSK